MPHKHVRRRELGKVDVVFAGSPAYPDVSVKSASAYDGETLPQVVQPDGKVV